MKNKIFNKEKKKKPLEDLVRKWAEDKYNKRKTSSP
jgi:hypothetical protein